MSAQLTLDYTAPTIGAFRASQPATARDAAVAAYATSGTQRQAILSALVAAGERGLTAHEAWEAVDGIAYPHVASTRLTELAKHDLVEQTPAKRPTPSGRMALVWVALPAGVAEVGA